VYLDPQSAAPGEGVTVKPKVRGTAMPKAKPEWTNKLFTEMAAYAFSMRVEGVKTATKYLDNDLTARLTINKWSFDKREKRLHLILSVGRPNYTERQFIKDCIKAGVKFPVRKVQLKFKPAKKRRAR
jgi:hypothetical protein